tara:strand:- start:27 stop:1199 length:1173 start_codon:yes stop_codon:yes gene_type:complete
MEETNTPMFKSTRSMENQMDEILSVEKDPVSGNTAPLGATPAEVRDDIPIMASPNEFMIDAATRRYYGTPFFENLQAAAKQGFKRIKAGEESFFRDDELEVEQEAQKMNEGGEVDTIEDREIPAPMGGGYGGYGGTGLMFTGFEFKIYIDPNTGREIQITFFNGRPLTPIPEGFVLKGDTAVEVQKQKEQSSGGGSDDRDRPKIPKTWENTPPSRWTHKDFINYTSDMSKLATEDIGKVTFADRFILGLVGGSFAPGLGVGLVTQAERIKRFQASSINKKINSLLEQGIDADGNPLTEETNSILFRAQQAANQADANLGGTTSTGIPITDQPFYQTETGEIDYDKLMPPGYSDDDEDGDTDSPFNFTEEEEEENLESRQTDPSKVDEEAI